MFIRHTLILPLTLCIALGLLPGPAAAKPARHAPKHAQHTQAQSKKAPPLTADGVNQAQYAPAMKLDGVSPVMLKTQILLDRNSISPGQIDGRNGDNARKAIAAFQQSHGLDGTGNLDEATWTALTQGSDQPALVAYEIQDRDVKGPFEKTIPKDLEKMARLHHLSYTSPIELLGEKFHVDPKLLERLNPGKRFDHAGVSILVPNVGDRDSSGPVAQIEVDKADHDVRALGQNGELIAFYPASIGSKEKPAPSGRYKIRTVAHNPTYHYDPKFQFKGVHTHRKLTVAPGPNNPVGEVWIDLTKESYGIHGTPEPDRIGKSYSHGCIRLTNWDALDLAKRVRKGTPVDFLDQPSAPPAAPAAGSGEARGRS